MRILKKYSAFLLVMLMVLGVVLSGCGSAEEETAAQETLVLASETAADASGVQDDEAAGADGQEAADREAGTEEEADADYKTEADEAEQQASAEDMESAADGQSAAGETPDEEDGDELLDENGSYFLKDEVALYIHQYGKLPANFITKKEAQALGWPGGAVEDYAPGKAIGGDRFGNYEGLLPEKKGRKYTECDIDTQGKKRGAKRIIFSNDGLIYYTEDHYKSFELLYGEE